MDNSSTILTIFAHPDDEIGAGSTLAYYNDKGTRTVLVCATRGEVATIFCDDCATREKSWLRYAPVSWSAHARTSASASCAGSIGRTAA